MYYKKMDNLPRLPEDLKQALVEEAINVFATQQENRILYHRRFELDDKNTLNYMGNEDMEFYEKSGGVSCLAMNAELENKVKDFFKKANHPVTNQFEYYGFLYVEGGPFCAPHIDDLERRRNGFQLLLKSGGDETTTAWWEPKEECKDSKIVDYSGIPYSKLDKVDEACLEENVWYWMKFDTIHSVEKIESLRIFLGTGIEGVGDIEYLAKDA